MQSVSPWQRNDAIMFLLSLCFSVLGVLFKKSLKGVCTCHNCLHYGKVLTDSMRVFLKYLEINNLFTLCVHIASYGCTREVCTKDASSISSMSQVFLQLVVVRRILITCIQLLFFFFFTVFARNLVHTYQFQNRSMKFLILLTITRSIVNKYTLQVSRTLKTGKAFKKGLKYNQFPPDVVFTSERPHYYSLALFSSFICTCTTSKTKNRICIKKDPRSLSEKISGTC